MYFTQKQKNVSKWLKVRQKNTQLERFHAKKNWGLKNTQSKTKLWTKECHGEYNISSTHVIDLNLKSRKSSLTRHQPETRSLHMIDALVKMLYLAFNTVCKTFLTCSIFTHKKTLQLSYVLKSIKCIDFLRPATYFKSRKLCKHNPAS